MVVTDHNPLDYCFDTREGKGHMIEVNWRAASDPQRGQVAD